MNGSKAKKLRKENPTPKKAKVLTPPNKRSFVTAFVPGAASTKHENTPQPRSEKAVKRFLDRFTPAPTE